jgi:hypothetical protein
MQCDALGRVTGLALCLGVLLLSLLVGSCGATGARPATVSGQEEFKVGLLADDAALDRGVLSYQAPVTLATGSSAQLNVEVIDVGKGNGGKTPPPVPFGWVKVQRDVPTGGMVGVTASCQGLSCGSEGDPERQSVLMFDQIGYWQWDISAQSPGTATIHLVATTYDQNTHIVLHVTPIEITLKVTASPGYWTSEVGHWMTGLLGFVGFAAIVTAIQGAWRWRTKRKANARPGGDETTTPPLQSAGAAAADAANPVQRPDDHLPAKS